jgi:prepilin-type processing-associated H-X9-DG protein
MLLTERGRTWTYDYNHVREKWLRNYQHPINDDPLARRHGTISERDQFRSKATINVAFVDGHVESMPFKYVRFDSVVAPMTGERRTFWFSQE